MNNPNRYYIPEPSHWPIVGSIGLFLMMIGFGNWLHGSTFGPYLAFTGVVVLLVMIFGWFGRIFFESGQGLYNQQVDTSYRWGMAWFIFSEIAFFAAFFGALFYARAISVPVLGGESYSPLTNNLLWPEFKAIWPLLATPDPGTFKGAKEVIGTWGLPALNTLILLTSGVTVTWAHHALKHEKQKQLIIGLSLTILLGALFLAFQISEYTEAYTHYDLKLSSGIYGSTFFMLTGFHGLHVTVGAIMLSVTLYRSIRGHFTPQSHFGFEAAAWYWHFVDVVWLFLFIFVYWL